MTVPLELTFRNVTKTEALEDLINQKVEKLEQVCDYMTSCRVVVEQPQKHQQTGSPYRIRIAINVPPGHEVVVRREASEGDIHDPLPQIIRDAFDTARRKLKRLVEKQRADVKVQTDQENQAIVTKVFRDEGYGFLRGVDGKEVYFHRNSVINNDFDRIDVGTGVRYVNAIGEKGPQATTVQIVDKPGARINK